MSIETTLQEIHAAADQIADTVDALRDQLAAKRRLSVCDLRKRGYSDNDIKRIVILFAAIPLFPLELIERLVEYPLHEPGDCD